MDNNDNHTPCVACPYCGASPLRFLRDGTRGIVSRTVEHGIVSKTPGSVLRWKCPACRRSFTEYPDSRVPGQRFSRECIYTLSERYLKDHTMTYRRTVCEDGIPIAYPETDQGNSGDGDEDYADTPILAHTTIYRWITALGAKQLPSDPCTTDAEPKQPSEKAESMDLPTRKYRSAARKDVLLQCRAALPPRRRKE